MWVILVICAAAIVILGCIRSKYERTCLATEYFELKSRKLVKQENYTIIFLSDLHNNTFGKDNQTLIQEIHRIHPDMILVGGDMIVSKGVQSVSIALDLLKELSKSYRVYYGNGNHESRMKEEVAIYGDLYPCYRKELEDRGVIVLENSTVEAGSHLAVSGLDLESDYYKKFKSRTMETGYIKHRLGDARSDYFTILMAHSPLFYSAYSQWGADLILSGHFHGGTIRIPWLGGVMTPQFHFFFPYCAGIFHRNKATMIVSRGLGTHSINIRLFNKPQLVVVHIEAE